jgi:hypothetical protein
LARALTREHLPHFRQRIERVTAQSIRHWGALEPVAMLTHLRQSFAMSLEEISIADRSNFLTRTVIKWLVLNVLPIPRGRIKVDQVLTPQPGGDAAAECALLFAAMDRFVIIAEKEPARRGLHPAFGRLTLTEWQRLHGKHIDHHLRQFGV